MYEVLIERGKIIRTIKTTKDRGFFVVQIPGKKREKAIAYFQFTGPVAAGDRILLNTAAVRLGLGTGGYHYIIANLNYRDRTSSGEMTAGHIMKLRYTPLQIKTLCAEEQDSPHHEIFLQEPALEGTMVVIIPLHSLLAPLTVVFNYFFSRRRLVYIMTGGGSLGIEESNLVKVLKQRDFLAGTVTPAHTFGGDIETVNIFTALQAAKEILKADLIVVGMGPGMTGTGTRFGFSGAEDCFISYAARLLGGRTVLVPRVSLQDKRKRHRILSHHTITLLTKLINERIEVIFPDCGQIKEFVRKNEIEKKHSVFYYPITEVEKILRTSEIKMKSMGRDFVADPLFFITAGLPVLHYNFYRGG